MSELKKFAEEFKKVNSGKHGDDRLAICRENFWEYEKYINPKFFREDRPHLKLIAAVLQALYEERIVKVSREIGRASCRERVYVSV